MQGMDGQFTEVPKKRHLVQQHGQVAVQAAPAPDGARADAQDVDVQRDALTHAGALHLHRDFPPARAQPPPVHLPASVAKSPLCAFFSRFSRVSLARHPSRRPPLLGALLDTIDLEEHSAWFGDSKGMESLYPHIGG
jgi:hypothetical protein